MKNFSLWLFVSLLPALAALGHDLYIAVDIDAMAFKERGFRLTALGKFWTDYAPDLFKMARAKLGAERWKEMVDPVLREPAAIVLLVFPAIVLVLHALLLLLGKDGWLQTRGISKGRPRKKGDFTFNNVDEGHKKTKYKRR